MKVWVTKAEPVLARRAHGIEHRYYVLNWRVMGTFLIDDNACPCGAEDFDISVNHDSLSVSKTQLVKLVETKLIADGKTCKPSDS